MWLTHIVTRCNSQPVTSSWRLSRNHGRFNVSWVSYKRQVGLPSEEWFVQNIAISNSWNKNYSRCGLGAYHCYILYSSASWSTSSSWSLMHISLEDEPSSNLTSDPLLHQNFSPWPWPWRVWWVSINLREEALTRTDESCALFQSSAGHLRVPKLTSEFGRHLTGDPLLARFPIVLPKRHLHESFLDSLQGDTKKITSEREFQSRPSVSERLRSWLDHVLCTVYWIRILAQEMFSSNGRTSVALCLVLMHCLTHTHTKRQHFCQTKS